MEEEKRFQSTFVTGDLSPISPEKKLQGEFFHIRQLSSSTTEDGGQLLDCRLGTDSETGLQQVEMIFSLNPFANGNQNGRDILSDSILNFNTSEQADSAVEFNTTNHHEFDVNFPVARSNIQTLN